jgi:HK97 family phage portal protein
VGLIRRGIDYAHRLGGLGGRRQAPDAPLPVPLSGGPSFPDIDRLFFATPFTGWSSLFSGVTQPYKQHVWVHACVNAIAQNISGVPLLFFTGSRKNKQLVDKGPLVKVMESPNPMMSGSQLIDASYVFLGITGEAIHILERNNVTEVPKEIWTFHPSRFQHVPDENSGLIRGWIYTRGSKRIPLEPHEVLFFRYFNPDDDYRGLSPLQAAKLGIDQDYYAAQYNANFFLNSAQPGGVLETSENLVQEEFDRLLAQWNDRHQGVAKGHQVALLEGGLTYKQTGISQRDMEFLEGRKYNREEVMAVYKVPKSELGLYEQINLATAKTMDRVFWTKTLLPKMVLFENILWTQFLSKLAGPEIWAEFDRTAIDALKEDLASLTDTSQKYWSMGVPFDIINETLGLGFPKIPGGDIGYLPFNLAPVGTANPPVPSAEPSKAAGSAGASPAILSSSAAAPRLPAPARRDAGNYWQQYNRLRTALEGKFQGKIKRYFFEQRQLQLQLLAEKLGGKALFNHVNTTKKLDPDDLLFDLEEANAKLKKLAWALYLNIGQEAGQALYVELGVDASEFVIADSAALQVLKTKLIKVTEINDLTRWKLRQTLSEGLEKLESASQLQQRVRDTFNFIESRSLTIARTETGQSMAAARDAAMDQLKVEKIEWGTAGDGAVRDSHAAQAGMVVVRGKLFPNGCAYPCDPAGAAAEVINCRCVAIPVLEKD